MGKSGFVILLLVVLFATICADMMRKSIVFDEKNPKVFYCPQEKPKGMNKMIVKARPIEKLCEFEGQRLPDDYRSDCYNDIDETEYACAEKERIMLRLNPPNDTDTTTMASTTRSHLKMKAKKI